MTENEAIKIIGNVPVSQVDCNNISEIVEAYTVAQKALEEIQQYRAIGTVEEIKSMKENGAFSGMELAQIASMQLKLKAYQSIGTIDEFKALKEKSVAKKQGGVEDIDSHLRLSKIGFLCCSKTNKAIRYPLISLTDLEYCPCCGQKLDWSE